jgi:putative transposase
VLRQVELLLRPLPPDYPCTTNSYHCLPVHRNRIKDLVVQQPNEVWVADLTYVRTEEGFLYLSLPTDKYSRKIAGYACGENLAMAGCVAALAMAVRERGLVFHGLDCGLSPACLNSRGFPGTLNFG